MVLGGSARPLGEVGIGLKVRHSCIGVDRLCGEAHDTFAVEGAQDPERAGRQRLDEEPLRVAEAVAAAHPDPAIEKFLGADGRSLLPRTISITLPTLLT